MWWADHWSTIEATWLLSPAGMAAGPLLRQPARTLVTVAMSVMLARPDLDVPKLRDVVVDWWDHPVLRRAPPPRQETVPQAPQTPALPAAGGPRPPVLGVKPAGGLVDDERLPKALRDMARRMGGVPAWWNGSGTAGEVALPAAAKPVGKLRG